MAIFREYPDFVHQLIPWIKKPKLSSLYGLPYPVLISLTRLPRQRNKMLGYSVRHNFIVISRRLLTQVSYPPWLLNSLLYEMVLKNQGAMVDLLLSSGANVNHPHFLVSAIKKNSKDLIMILLRYHPDIHYGGILKVAWDEYQVDHDLPLAYAIMENDPEMVQLLLNAGADPHSGGRHIQGMVDDQIEECSHDLLLTLIRYYKLDKIIHLDELVRKY